MEPTILCGRGHGNQALEGLCFNLFCHFRVHVFGTCLFHDLCHDFVTFGAFVCPFRVYFGQHVVIFLNSIFKHKKNEKIEMVEESRQGHLGHILDKGGTGRRLGGIWEVSGRHLGGTWELGWSREARGNF